MDSKKILEKYLKPAAAIKLIGIVLVIASLAMLVMGILTAAGLVGTTEDPVMFDNEDTKSGTYAYIKVVGISDWVYKVDGDTYYVVLDKNHDAYVVRVSNSEFNKMDEQNEYFMEDDASMPKAYQLSGVARKLTTNYRNEIADCFDIPSYESQDYFGTMYLDATSTPGTDGMAMWMVGFILCLTFGILFLAISLPASGNFKKCVAALEERGMLDMAAAELESGTCEQVGKDCAKLGRQFIFGKNSGIVLPYSEIQWLYRQTVKRNFITVAVNLVVCTNKLNQKVLVSYKGKNRDEDLNKVFMTVAERNPHALLGYSSENRKEYKERKNAAKLG